MYGMRLVNVKRDVACFGVAQVFSHSQCSRICR